MDIHSAATSGNNERLIDLLKSGISVDIRTDDSMSMTPLMNAAWSPDADVATLRILVEHGAELDAISDFGRHTALSLAAGNLQKFEYLLAAGANPFAGCLSTRGFPSGTNMQVAVRMLAMGYDPAQCTDDALDLTAEIERLKEELGLDIEQNFGFDVTNIQCPSFLNSVAHGFDLAWLKFFEQHKVSFAALQWDELMREIVMGTADTVAEKLKQNPDLTATDCSRRTAFMLSVRSGDLQKAQLVIEAADKSATRLETYSSILECAIESKSTEMLNWVVTLAPTETSTAALDEALMYASEEGNTDAVRKLLESGANPLISDKWGIQPINVAKNIETTKLLVNAGADIDRVDGRGIFLLMSAVEQGDLEFLKELIEFGANVKTHNFGKTALHQATNYSEPEMMRLLIEAGADLNAEEEDYGACTPLDMARTKEIAQILIDAGARSK